MQDGSAQGPHESGASRPSAPVQGQDEDDTAAPQQMPEESKAMELSITADPSSHGQDKCISAAEQPAAAQQHAPQQMHDGSEAMELSKIEDPSPGPREDTTATQQPAAAANTQPESELDCLNPEYLEGCLVDVDSRTWPGINKPGGRAKVTYSHRETVFFGGDTAKQAVKITHVDVTYVLGGREKKVDITYVKSYADSDTSRNVQGRCDECGAFLIDCNFCGWKTGKDVMPDDNIKVDRKLGYDDDLVDTDLDADSDMDSDEEDRMSLEILARLLKREREILKRKRRTGMKAASKAMANDQRASDVQPKKLKLTKGFGAKKSGSKAKSASLDSSDQHNSGDSDLSDSQDMVLSSLKESPDAQNDQTSSEVRRKKRRKHVKGSLESLPEVASEANPTSTNSCGKADGEDLDNRKSNGTRLADNADMDNSDDDEVEILHTPRKDFLFDQDSENNYVNRADAVKPEKLLTPKDMDEDSGVEFGGNDEISFHGDNDDDGELLTPRTLDEDASVESERNDDVSFQGDPDYDSDYNNDESNKDEMEFSSENESIAGDSADKINVESPNPVKYTDLLEFIGNLASELETTTIPDAKQKCAALKLRLSLWDDKNKNKPELLSIKQECYKLHKHIIQKLIREGIDKCNGAMIRLVRERKLNHESRTHYRKSRASKERCEVLLGQLEMGINDVDNEVNAMRKEIDVLWSDIHDSYLGDERVDDSFSDSVQGRMSRAAVARTRGDTEFDPHQHASKKRKPTSQRTLHKEPRECSGSRESLTRHRKSSVGDIRKRQRQDQREPSSRKDSSHGQSVNVDFGGETDENDIPLLMAGQTHNAASIKGRQQALGSSFRSVQSRPISQPIQNPSDKVSYSAQAGNSRTGKAFNQQSQSKLDNLNSRTSKVGVISVNVPRSRSLKEQSSNAERISANEPSLPASLCVEDLFQSLSILNKDSFKECSDEISSHATMEESVDELCATLVQHYPNNLPSCRTSISNLCHLAKAGLRDDEVVAIFHSLHTVFQTKCSIFLDLLRSDANDACFQISCWSLIFQMMSRKLHLRLQEKDGVLYKVFRNATSLAGQIVIQMIDSLYSQLLWQEYGATTRFDGQVFKCLDQLRDQIGMVVPLLPLVADLLRSKFGCQSWHRSKMADQKENNLSALYFVSAINPDDHVQFLMAGQNLSSPEGGSRLSKFGRNTSRREIHAMWFMICYFSSNPTHATYSDCKKTISMLSSIIHSNCGIFPKDQPPSELPPNAEHIDTCCKEIHWIATLISSKSFGHLPDLDSFLSDLIQRAVLHESKDTRLSCLPNSSHASIKQLVTKYWHGSSLSSARRGVDNSECSDSLELSSFLVADESSKVWDFSPSTRLLQMSSLALQSYASLAMQKKAKCKRLSGTLNTLISVFENKALEFEAKENSTEENTVNDFSNAFASIFLEINEFTRDKRVDPPHAAYFRESACFIVLSVLIARRDSTFAGIDIGLNKTTRERLLRLSSDMKTGSCQMQCIEAKSGCQVHKAPPCSNNLCSLYVSAKILYTTAMLHLFVDSSKDPPILLASLEKHLAALGADDDTNMLQYLVAAITAPLLGCCDMQDTLSKDTVDSTLDCLEVVRSIALWISCIYQRAHSIFIASTRETIPNNVKVIVDAIMKLGSANFSCFVLNSLTRVLTSIISSIPFRLSSNAAGVLKTAFRSCLVAMRMVVRLVHLCRKNEPCTERHSASDGSKTLFVDACDCFQQFLTSKVMPSLVTINASSHERVLCQDQSGALMAVYAAFLSLCEDRSVVEVFRIFVPNQIVDDDTSIFFKQLRACFCCELTRLSNFQSCRKLALLMIESVLEDVVLSLLDSETLMMFPPRKIKQAPHTEGYDLRVFMPYQNPDEEATRIAGNQDECLDAVGPEYMSKNMWSFCDDVGNLLVSEGAFRDIGQVLVDTCVDLRSSQDLLKMVPSVSCERECMKRLILICNILTKSTEAKYQVSGIIVNAMFENLYRLIGIGLYHEKQRNDCVDEKSRFERRKAMHFQKAYVKFSGSLMTLMLRENAIENSDKCAFVRDVLITRSFAATSTIRGIIETAHEKQVANMPLFQFSLRKKIGSVTESEQLYLAKMTSDFCSTFLSRADDLLVHAINCHSEGGTKAILHSIMSANLMQQADHMKSFSTIASDVLFQSNSSSIIEGSTLSRSDLQTAINRYTCHTKVNGSGSTPDGQAIVNYRDWVIDPFLTNRLGTPNMPPGTHKITLQLLAEMLKNLSLVKIKCDENRYAKIAHSLKVCLCSQYKYMDAGFMQLWMKCANSLFSMQAPNDSATDQSETALKNDGATDQSETTTDVQMKRTTTYNVEFSKWLKFISILPMQEISTVLDAALSGVDNMQPKSSPHTKTLRSCHESMHQMERLLFPDEVLAPNPYAKRN